MHCKKGLNSLFHDNWVAQLPDGEWASLKEALNAVVRAAVDQLWPKARFGHALEERRLDLLIDNLTFKFAIKERSGSLTVERQFNIAFQSDSVACVTEAT